MKRSKFKKLLKRLRLQPSDATYTVKHLGVLKSSRGKRVLSTWKTLKVQVHLKGLTLLYAKNISTTPHGEVTHMKGRLYVIEEGKSLSLDQHLTVLDQLDKFEFFKEGNIVCDIAISKSALENYTFWMT